MRKWIGLSIVISFLTLIVTTLSRSRKRVSTKPEWILRRESERIEELNTISRQLAHELRSIGVDRMPCEVMEGLLRMSGGNPHIALINGKSLITGYLDLSQLVLAISPILEQQ